MPSLTKSYLLVTDFMTDNTVFRFDAITGAPESPIKVVQRPPTEYPDMMPFGLTKDRSEIPYVSIRNRGWVYRYRPEINMFDRFAEAPEAGGFGVTARTSFDRESERFSSRIYLCNGTEGVRVFSGSKGFDLGAFVPAGSGSLGQAFFASFGPDGNFYVGESFGRVLCYDGQSGAFVKVFVERGSGGLDYLDGLTFGPDGHLYVVSRETNNVLRYDGTTGAFIDEFASNIPFTGGLRFGPDGNLYVCSSDSIKRYNGTTGAYENDFVTGGGLYLPNDLEFVRMASPGMGDYFDWQRIPRWLQAMGVGFVIGWAMARFQQPRSRSAQQMNS
jgi:hypothetical protein